jgi:hypothetical protein
VFADDSGGYINSHLKIVRPVAWVGYGLAGLGYSLFYAFFTYPIPLARQEGLQIITGVGIGFSIVVPLIVLQSAMPLKEMAATTGAWSMTRSIGGSVGKSSLRVFTGINGLSLTQITRSGNLHCCIEYRRSVPIRGDTRVRDGIPSTPVR